MSLFAKAKKEYRSEEDQKRAEDLANQVSRNLVVQKMPKGYKSNSFSYAEYFGDKVEKTTKNKAADISAPAPHKKTGLIIMAVGVLVIAGLGYIGFRFFFSPNNSAVNNQVSTNQTNNSSSTTTPTNSSSTPTSTPEIISTTTASSTSPIITPAQISDTDADGLSDEEERALGTDITSPDTDGDGYNDLTEVVGLYNPTGKGKLTDDPSLKRYASATKSYFWYYSKNWVVSVADQGNTVVFTAPDNSFFQIVVQPNNKKQTIKDWVLAELNLTADSLITTSWGEGVKNSDGSIYYFTDKAKKQIYVFSYVPATGQASYYQNLFDAVVKLFGLGK